MVLNVHRSHRLIRDGEKGGMEVGRGTKTPVLSSGVV